MAMQEILYATIDTGSVEGDRVYISSIYESRKDAPTPDTWLFTCNNETNYLDTHRKFYHFISNRLQSRLK